MAKFVLNGGPCDGEVVEVSRPFAPYLTRALASPYSREHGAEMAREATYRTYDYQRRRCVAVDDEGRRVEWLEYHYVG